MSISVGSLFLAEAVPGLMIALALMATVYGYAVVYDYPTAGKPTLAEFWSAPKGAGLALLTPVIVIGGIVGGIVTPTESAQPVQSTPLNCCTSCSIYVLLTISG